MIAGNFIDGAGVEFVDAPGIMVGYAQNTDIENNYIANTAWAGIALGWGWGLRDEWPLTDSAGHVEGSFPGLDGATPGMWGDNDTPTIMGDNKIVGNIITGFLQKGWDGGAVYTTGFQDGNFNDPTDPSDPNWHGTLIAGNVAFGKTPTAGGNAVATRRAATVLTRNTLVGNQTGTINLARYSPDDELNANNPFALTSPISQLRQRYRRCFTYGGILYMANLWRMVSTNPSAKTRPTFR